MSILMNKIIVGLFLSVLLLSVIVAYDGTASAQLKSTKDLDSDKDGIPDEVDPFIPAPRVWQTSGPFQIDREQYVLGELVLARIGDLQPNEKGQIAFLRSLNETHYDVYITIPFDGSQKITFNQYFKPSLSRGLGICTKDDLLGQWRVVFQGTNYENLNFEIIDKIIPGEEVNYEGNIC